MDGIVLQQVGHRRNVAQIVYGDHFELGIVRHRTEHQTADATESVNTYLGCHSYPLSIKILKRACVFEAMVPLQATKPL